MNAETDKLAIILDILQPFAPNGTVIEADTALPDLIDSAAMVNILLELEHRLGIEIQAADLTFDHFQSPRILAERFAGKADD